MAKKDKKTSFLKSKRFKYGTSAIIFTVVFVAAIIAFNVIFTSLSQTYLWYVDMTDEQIYSLSDEARIILDSLEDGTNIEFIFCCPLDQLENNLYQKQVYTLIQNMAREYDFISYDSIDIITNPDEARQYRINESATLKTTNVIISNGNDFRVHTIESFYTFAESDNSVFAFNGEKKMLSSMLQLQGGDKLIAYFTTNHGEKVEQNSYLWTLFEEAGFDVRKIDLTKEDIDPKAKIVIINGPKFDFWGAYDDVNEIKKVDDFVDRYGSLMVFLDPDTQKLPEIEELLSEWGIEYEDAVIKDYSSSVTTDGTGLVAVYPTEGLGASLHSTLRAMENPPLTISRYTRPIKMLWGSDYHNSRSVTTVLTTTENAVAYYKDEDNSTAQGPFDIMVLAAELRYVDNEQMYTYVIAGGSSQFNDERYLSGAGYGNEEILGAIMSALGKEKTPVGLDFKVYDKTTLDITTAQATRWTILFTLLIPAVVAAVGVVVWARRRHL